MRPENSITNNAWWLLLVLLTLLINILGVIDLLLTAMNCWHNVVRFEYNIQDTIVIKYDKFNDLWFTWNQNMVLWFKTTRIYHFLKANLDLNIQSIKWMCKYLLPSLILIYFISLVWFVVKWLYHRSWGYNMMMLFTDLQILLAQD